MVGKNGPILGVVTGKAMSPHPPGLDGRKVMGAVWKSPGELIEDQKTSICLFNIAMENHQF